MKKVSISPNLKVDSFQQISLTVTLDLAEQVTDILQSCGAMSVSIVSGNEQECFDISVPGNPQWNFQQLSAIFDQSKSMDPIKELLSKYLVHSSNISIAQIQDQDWERKWLDSFEPIRVGKGLWVCPGWCEPIDMDAINLVIDPGLAFGTGSHETTQLCLNYLSNGNLKSKTILDFGCGSGILGIAGVLLGADSALGVDIDPKAVQTAIKNIRINKITDRMSVMSNDDFAAMHTNYKADIVIANILEQTIILLSDEFCGLVRTGGKIILSGILKHQVKDVVNAFPQRYEFTQYEKNGWVLLLGQMRIH